ncbi:hypothetical protein CAMSH0001_1646 [Campylobacter showae RM3277]|uniref:Uncharacterized protein n=1 Tax=Campylobacter showae RM3277 TaxID=553219 RepID=C6RH12_9BACT|nr:hypothetical protein CAMSH0001_1646 [Campylobacter showae RM3277]
MLPSCNERSEVKGGDIASLTQSVASFVNFDGVKFINL